MSYQTQKKSGGVDDAFGSIILAAAVAVVALIAGWLLVPGILIGLLTLAAVASLRLRLWVVAAILGAVIAAALIYGIASHSNPIEMLAQGFQRAISVTTQDDVNYRQWPSLWWKHKWEWWKLTTPASASAGAILGAAGALFARYRAAGRLDVGDRKAKGRRLRKKDHRRLGVGTVARSERIGRGDLGWGSRRGFQIPKDALTHHVIVAGASGSGKTKTTERIEFEAASSWKPQIIHFDCKGVPDGPARFLAMMTLAGYDADRIRIFPHEPYDGWRTGKSKRRALLNRLLCIQDFDEPYYEATTKDFLQQALAASNNVPDSSVELLSQLAAKTDGVDPKVATGTIARYRGFFAALEGALDGAWAFEDADACYVQLQGLALKENATAVGRFLLEDFANYIVERKPMSREVLLMLDEFSAISAGAEASNLIERAREFGVGVVMTTQSYAGLGAGAERILDACNGALVIHRVADPASFTTRAGTVIRKVKSQTIAKSPGLLDPFATPAATTPTETYHDMEFPRVEPNEVRQLRIGEAFVISAGRAQKVAIQKVEALDADLIGRAEAELDRRQLAAAPATKSDRAEPQPTDDDLDF